MTHSTPQIERPLDEATAREFLSGYAAIDVDTIASIKDYDAVVGLRSRDLLLAAGSFIIHHANNVEDARTRQVLISEQTETQTLFKAIAVLDLTTIKDVKLTQTTLRSGNYSPKPKVFGHSPKNMSALHLYRNITSLSVDAYEDTAVTSELRIYQPYFRHEQLPEYLRVTRGLISALLEAAPPANP